MKPRRRNGTKVNNKVLPPQAPEALRDGDLLQFGICSDSGGSEAMVFRVEGVGKARNDVGPRSTESGSTEYSDWSPCRPLPASARKYTARVVACLREGLAAAQRTGELHNVDALKVAAGKVVTGLKQIGEVYGKEQGRRSRDIERGTVKVQRRKQRHDEHDPVVGTSVARKRRSKAKQQKKVPPKDHGVHFTITGISKAKRR